MSKNKNRNYRNSRNGQQNQRNQNNQRKTACAPIEAICIDSDYDVMYEYDPVVEVRLSDYRALIESNIRIGIAAQMLENETGGYIGIDKLSAVFGYNPKSKSDNA